MTQPAALLRAQAIEKSFFGVPVLKGVDFDLGHGEAHVLLGENGAGKSTLMKILSGAYRPDAGSLALEGQPIDLAGYSPRRAEDLGIVTVYQNFHLIPHLSVAENIALAGFAREHGLIHWREVYARADRVLGVIGIPINPKARVRDLPVSQQQLLEIAIALSKQARVLIMDEPTAALSQAEIETLFGTIADVKRRGIGIIYISHKLEEVKQVGDRITILRDGFKVATLDAADADVHRIIGLMIGKELARSHPARTAPQPDALFRVDGLRTARLPHPVSFTVRRNEVLGITGVIGSGKTELARGLFGVDPLAAGRLELAGRPVAIDSPRTAIGLGLGYLPEDRDASGLCLTRSVKENLSLVALSKRRGQVLNTAAEKRAASALVSAIGIRSAGLSQQVKYLSGGNKQKVVFGKWLGADCRLLVLDEPTIGIDVGARGDLYDLIRDFAGRPDHSVIFISSDPAEVLEVTDRVLVMAGGQLVAELDPKHATKQDVLRYGLRPPATAQV
jgi:ribose transport system ATP-binding protein